MIHSVELTLARLAFRQFLGSRRALLLGVLALLPVLVVLLVGMENSGGKEALEDFTGIYRLLTVGVLLPIVALVLGTGVFGAEVDDGTITYVLGKPVPRWRIVVTRIVAAGLATALVLVPSTLATAAVGLRGADAPGALAASAVAVAIGGFLYCALFVALSLSPRRARVAGLVYVGLWEGSLSNTFGGSRALSIRQYTLSFAERMADGVSFGGRLDAGVAVAMAAAVAVLATAHAIRRLRRFEVGEAA